jgi:transcriptional regulator with XRE-family HTH domain
LFRMRELKVDVNALNELRQAAGLTRIALCEKAGISRVTFHAIEHKRAGTKAETRQRLAEALGVERKVIEYWAGTPDPLTEDVAA